MLISVRFALIAAAWSIAPRQKYIKIRANRQAQSA